MKKAMEFLFFACVTFFIFLTFDYRWHFMGTEVPISVKIDNIKELVTAIGYMIAIGIGTLFLREGKG